MRSFRDRGDVNTWPGFVDALANMLIVMTVVLLLFFVFQVYLGDTLSGRNREIVELKSSLQELGKLLSLEKSAKQDVEGKIVLLQSLLRVTEEREQLLKEELVVEREERTKENLRRGIEMSTLEDERGLLEQDLSASRGKASELEAEILRMQQVVVELQAQLRALNATLAASEAQDLESQAVIKSLGERLNVALAGKVQELAEYRSDFFGRLKKVLSGDEKINVVGDRFVFSSEVLFDTGKSELEEAGKAELTKLAETLIDLSSRIPEDINWLLQVEGHTDDVPIETPLFSSNWELSSARAVSVVRHMISVGVPPERLSTAGFAEYQPVVDISGSVDVDVARQQNRRIELRLTQH